jgi:Serine hydrolase (FSH1)
MRKLRVLCLHGYHGSAKTLRLQMRPFTQGLEPLAEFVCVDAPSLAVGDFGWWHAVSRDGDDRSRRGSANRRCGTKDGRKRRIGWFRYLCKAPRSTAYSASVRELRSHRFLSVYGIPVKRKLASRLISQSWWVALPVTTAVTRRYINGKKNTACPPFTSSASRILWSRAAALITLQASSRIP